MKDREEAAFTEFVIGTSDRLFRSAYALAGDYQLAEDALQAAYASAYSSWRRVSTADNPEAYVRRMLMNHLFSWWRRKPASAERISNRVPERPAASHEDAVVAADEVWLAVQRLPPRQRAVVVLRFFEDMTEADIASTLGIRPGTVKSQSSAALSSLRKWLAQDRLPSPEGKP